VDAAHEAAPDDPHVQTHHTLPSASVQGQRIPRPPGPLDP